MKNLLTCLLLFVTATSTCLAHDRELGIGLMLGNPTGLNGKFWLNDEHAIDGGLGVSLGKHNDFTMHSDYLFHSFSAFYLNDTVPLDLYYGVGARMEFADDIELGLRVPVGLAHVIKESNSDVFAEVAPILDFAGRTGVELHIAVGGRYYY